MAFGKDGRFAYAIGEMLATGDGVRYNSARGTLQELQTAPVTPDAYTGQKSGAEIAVAPGRQVPLRFKSRDSTRRGFRIDAIRARLTVSRARLHPGQDAAQFCHRPERGVSIRRQSGFRHRGRVQNRSSHWPLDSHGNCLELASPVCVVFAPAH